MAQSPPVLTEPSAATDTASCSFSGLLLPTPRTDSAVSPESSSSSPAGASPGSPPTLRYISDSVGRAPLGRSEEHTSELQSLMRISYAVFCLKKKKKLTTKKH